MPDKNQNNVPGWQTRLENLDQVPSGMAFNKDEAWNKLYAKLEPSETRNHNAWIGIVVAAAAILTGLFFSTPWFNHDKKETVQLAKQQGPATVKDTAEGLEKPLVSKPEQTMASRNILTVTKKNTKDVAVRPIIKTPVTEPVQTDLSPAISSIQSTPLPVAGIEKNLELPSLSPSPLLAAKKKVPVVYLNELESGHTDMITNYKKPKPQRKQYPNLGQAAPEDVFVASQPERFTISLSSAN